MTRKHVPDPHHWNTYEPNPKESEAPEPDDSEMSQLTKDLERETNWNMEELENQDNRQDREQCVHTSALEAFEALEYKQDNET